MSLRIWEHLSRKARDLMSGEEHTVRIRGLWSVRYRNQVSNLERTFSGHMLLAQSSGQGTCLSDEDPMIDLGIVGEPANNFIGMANPLSIALLDSIYNGICERPCVKIVVDGDPANKAKERAEVVAREASLLVDGSANGKKAVLVGFVSEIARRLRRAGFDLACTDSKEEEWGTEHDRFSIEDPSRSEICVAEADVAVITGMTLQTGSLDSLLEVATAEGTGVVVFAQTGANIAREYVNFGADVVVAEPFPKYDFHGTSEIWIHRR